MRRDREIGGLKSLSFAIRFVVFDFRHFRQRVPFVDPTAEIDQPATIAAERQRRRFGGLEVTFAGRTTHGNRGSMTRRSSARWALQSFFGFFGFAFDSPPDDGFSEDDFSELFSDDFSLELLEPSDDFLSFAAAFLYESLR